METKLPSYTVDELRADLKVARERVTLIERAVQTLVALETLESLKGLRLTVATGSPRGETLADWPELAQGRSAVAHAEGLLGLNGHANGESKNGAPVEEARPLRPALVKVVEVLKQVGEPLSSRVLHIRTAKRGTPRQVTHALLALGVREGALKRTGTRNKYRYDVA